jgi:putative flippase GtrA
MTGQIEHQAADKKMPNRVSAIWRSRFVRFLLVGGVNTAFSYVVYALFLLVGLNYIFSSLFALIAGILFSFRTQGAFVFDNSDSRLLGRFALCWAFIYFGNVMLIKAMIILGMDAYTAGAFAIPPTAIVSYLIQKFVVFRRAGTSGPRS